MIKYSQQDLLHCFLGHFDTLFGIRIKTSTTNRKIREEEEEPLLPPGTDGDAAATGHVGECVKALVGALIRLISLDVAFLRRSRGRR